MHGCNRNHVYCVESYRGIFLMATRVWLGVAGSALPSPFPTTLLLGSVLTAELQAHTRQHVSTHKHTASNHRPPVLTPVAVCVYVCVAEALSDTPPFGLSPPPASPPLTPLAFGHRSPRAGRA